MISRKFFSRSFWLAVLIAAVTLLALFLTYRSNRDEAYRNSFIAVGLYGVHHMGPNFNISEFYVDRYNGMNVGREGGGGGEVCCVLLPKKWRPGMVVELRWAVTDWSKVDPNGIDGEAYKSVTDQFFKAMVPVEKYQTPARIFVHFFAGGKARVVSSFPGPENREHPVQKDDPHAADSATVGQVVDNTFTKEELAEMDREREKRNAFFGDWR